MSFLNEFCRPVQVFYKIRALFREELGFLENLGFLGKTHVFVFFKATFEGVCTGNLGNSILKIRILQAQPDFLCSYKKNSV